MPSRCCEGLSGYSFFFGGGGGGGGATVDISFLYR